MRNLMHWRLEDYINRCRNSTRETVQWGPTSSSTAVATSSFGRAANRRRVTIPCLLLKLCSLEHTDMSDMLRWFRPLKPLSSLLSCNTTVQIIVRKSICCLYSRLTAVQSQCLLVYWRMCSVIDTVTDWWQKLHSSWAVEQFAGRTMKAKDQFWTF